MRINKLIIEKMVNIEKNVIFVMNYVLNDFIENHLKLQTHTNKICKREQLSK